MALPPRGDVCADLAAWRREGNPLRTVRAATAEYRSVYAAFGRGFQRKAAAAADRMRELGVSEQDAKVSHSFRVTFAALREPLRGFRSELANVATADPLLASGRAAVRRMGRRLDALPAPGRFCAELRAWRRAGYPRSTVRKAEAALRAALGAIGPGIVRKLEATAMRLRELGVSRADAEAFVGEGGW